MSKMNPVVHFEMSAEDGNRISEFYSKVFGWQVKQLGEELGGYILVTTTETDDTGLPKSPGAINGGFYRRTEDPALNQPSVVISVNDINESIERININGGKILGKIEEIPGIGTYISFLDIEGNRVGMLQPSQM